MSGLYTQPYRRKSSATKMIIFIVLICAILLGVRAYLDNVLTENSPTIPQPAISDSSPAAITPEIQPVSVASVSAPDMQNTSEIEMQMEPKKPSNKRSKPSKTNKEVVQDSKKNNPHDKSLSKPHKTADTVLKKESSNTKSAKSRNDSPIIIKTEEKTDEKPYKRRENHTEPRVKTTPEPETPPKKEKRLPRATKVQQLSEVDNAEVLKMIVTEEKKAPK